MKIDEETVFLGKFQNAYYIGLGKFRLPLDVGRRADDRDPWLVECCFVGTIVTILRAIIIK
jgi:hypothetical protein